MEPKVQKEPTLLTLQMPERLIKTSLSLSFNKSSSIGLSLQSRVYREVIALQSSLLSKVAIASYQRGAPCSINSNALEKSNSWSFSSLVCSNLRKNGSWAALRAFSPWQKPGIGAMAESRNSPCKDGEFRAWATHIRCTFAVLWPRISSLIFLPDESVWRTQCMTTYRMPHLLARRAWKTLPSFNSIEEAKSASW